MPIEFPCLQCGRTLRTPDGSAGKRAKCPSCESIADIPAQSTSPADEDPFAGLGGPSASGGNPFGDTSVQSGSSGLEDPANPYASPQTGGMTHVAARAGTLQHAKLDFGEVLGLTWRLFNEHMGNLLLLILTMMGIGIGLEIVVVIGAVVGGLISMAVSGGEQTMVIIGAIVGASVVGVGLLFVMGWLAAGVTQYTLSLARSEPANFNDIFNGQRFALRMTGSIFVTQVLLIQGLTFLGASPGFFIWHDPLLQIGGQYLGLFIGSMISGLLFALSGYFIVDRDVGVLQSFGMSIKYLNGNRLALFGVYFVVGLVGMLVTMLTCGIGMFFYIPYYLMLGAVIYLLATGQLISQESPALR